MVQDGGSLAVGDAALGRAVGPRELFGSPERFGRAVCQRRRVRLDLSDPVSGRIEDRLDLVLVPFGRAQCADRRNLRFEGGNDDVQGDLLDLLRRGLALAGQEIVGRRLDL